jgi:hypothetical protein
MPTDPPYIFVSKRNARKIWQLNKSDLSQVAESPRSLGPIYCFTEDSEYLYYLGCDWLAEIPFPQFFNSLWKVRKSDMTIVLKSYMKFVNVLAMVCDDEFIYFPISLERLDSRFSGLARNIAKMRKSNFEIVATSHIYGEYIFALAQDNAFLYVGGTHVLFITEGTAYPNVGEIWKIRKSDLHTEKRSPIYLAKTLAIAVDNDFVYAGGNKFRDLGPEFPTAGISCVLKLNISNLEIVSECQPYGEQVLALVCDDDFVYCGGVNYIYRERPVGDPFTYNFFKQLWVELASSGMIGRAVDKVWKIRKSDMTALAESDEYGGYITSLVVDSTYIFVGGTLNRKVWKMLKHGLHVIAESLNFGSDIYALAEDSEFIYAAGEPNNIVRKIRKSDMLIVAYSNDYGSGIYALSQDEDFIYCGGYFTNVVWKIRKSDMNTVVESGFYIPGLCGIVNDEFYVYAVGYFYHKVVKLRKDDLHLVSESPDYGAQLTSICESGFYVYAAGMDTRKVWQILKSDMSLAEESDAYPGNIFALANDDDYVYCGGGGSRTIWKIRKLDMEKIAESVNYGGTIFAIALKGEYVLCGGNGCNKVSEFLLSDLSLFATSIPFSAEIKAIATDANFIYCAGLFRIIFKLEQSGLSKIAESASHGGDILCLTSK